MPGTQSIECTHLVVGAGRMGGALLSGWIKGKNSVIKSDQVAILDPNPGSDAQKAIDAGAQHLTEPDKGLQSIQHVLLAVKPQMFADIGPNIAKHVPANCLIISIMAGTTLASLKDCFPSHALVRAMPNTPAAIGSGITAFTCDENVSDSQKEITKTLLSAGGAVHEVISEHLIDVVTAVSGSGPAYVFHLVEALEAAALEAGLPKEIAPDFARRTITGAGALLEQSPLSATELREAVTSPNGTTQAALEVLMSTEGLPPLMDKTVHAALIRAKELGQG